MISLNKVLTKILPAAILTISLLSAVSASANPADEIEISYAGGTLWSQIIGIEISGDYVYYTTDFEFFVVDVTDKNAPSTVGRVAVAGARRIAINGQYAYVTSRTDGLKIINISNPENPVLVHTPQASDIDGRITISGTYIYTATDSLRVYDIGNPTQPILVANGGSVCKASELIVVDELLYMAAGDCGVYIFDISDPLNPVQVANYSDLGISAVDIDVIGDFVYIVDGYGLIKHPPLDFPASLMVVDISELSNPQIVSVNNMYHAMSVSHEGDHAFVSEGWELSVFDISNVATPRPIGSVYYVSSHNFVVSDGYVFAASYIYGFRIIDVRTPSNPIIVGDTDIISSPLFVSVSGNKAVVQQSVFSYTSFTSFSRLTFLDISNPYLPVAVGSLDFSSWINSFELHNEKLYVADDSVGIRIFDISNPQAPDLLGSYPILNGADNIIVRGPFAIVTTGENELLLINISNPASPTLTGSFKTSSFATGLQISQGRAYILQSDSTLEIVDITDPRSPKFCSNIKLPHRAYGGLVVTDDLALVSMEKRIWTGTAHEIYVIDITDPCQPEYGDDRPLSGWVLDKYENYVFIATDWGSRIQILDHTDKSDLQIIGEYTMWGSTRSAEYSDGFLYLAADIGFVILQASLLPTGIEDAPLHILPESFSLSQNYPNPFNPSTTIEFDLPTKSRVKLVIFNMLGQKVITLVDERMSAGHKAVTWNGRNSFGNQLSSGLYLYRLEADGFVQNKKMILLK